MIIGADLDPFLKRVPKIVNINEVTVSFRQLEARGKFVRSEN